MARHTRLVGAACMFSLGLFTFAFLAARAAAQDPDKLMVTGEAAKKALTNGEISGDAATKIAQGCLDFAAQHNFAAVIFILDPFGDIVHAHRMDGIRPVQFQSALGKAKAALFSRAANRGADVH